MSSVLDQVQCPQCSYDQADLEYACGTDEEYMICRRCGYEERWEAKRDDEGKITSLEHKIEPGAGVLSYHAKAAIAFCAHSLSTKEEVDKAEEWLRQAMTAGQVYKSTAYVTRWNAESMQVEAVVGSFFDGWDAVLREEEAEEELDRQRIAEEEARRTAEEKARSDAEFEAGLLELWRTMSNRPFEKLLAYLRAHPNEKYVEVATKLGLPYSTVISLAQSRGLLDQALLSENPPTETAGPPMLRHRAVYTREQAERFFRERGKSLPASEPAQSNKKEAADGE